MLRQIIGYTPSTVVPAAISLLMIYVYTRILTPSVYGDFSLFYSAVLVVQTSFFFAIPMALTRFYPEAMAKGRSEVFLAECYLLFYLFILLILIPIGSICVYLLSYPPAPLALAALVLIARSAVVLNQSVSRINLYMCRYNTIECVHAVLGFALGLVFIWMFGASGEALMFGLLVAAVICVLADFKYSLLFLKYMRHRIDWRPIGRLAKFSAPLILMDTAICTFALSDRFLLEKLGGAAALGIYTVAYNLVERPISLICAVVTTATFPIAVRVLQADGRDASGLQAGHNAAVLLALVIPGCIGLGLIAPYLAATMIGEQFRLGVAALIPVLCITAMFRGISTHSADHAFHLASRPTLALLVYIPAAAINIGLNVVLIPEYGAQGAAWVGLVCQAVATFAGLALGRHVFPIRWPLRETFKILAGVVPMALVLTLADFPASWAGLSMAVVAGASAFGVSAVALDICGARAAVRRYVQFIWLLRLASVGRHGAASSRLRLPHDLIK